MRALLEFIWKLSTLRAGPEQMPAAPQFTTTLLFADLTVSVLVAVTTGLVADVMLALTGSVLGLATLAGALWLALAARGLGHRFTQTLGALLAIDTFITLLAWLPLLMTVPGTRAEPPVLLPAFLLELGVFAWWIVSAGATLGRALDVARSQGIAFALLIFLASIILDDALIERARGAPAQATTRDAPAATEQFPAQFSTQFAMNSATQHFARHLPHPGTAEATT